MKTERAIELLHRLQDEQFDGIHGDERREALDMAVRALEGDGDTISRKMAIDAFEPEHDTDWYTPRIIEVLEALPPVQSTQTNADSTHENTLDCVSRQAVIDIVRNRVKRFTTACVLAVTEIEQLQSAQPERDIPVKPIETTDKAWGIPKRQAVCPKCDYYLGHVAFLGDYKGKRVTYCETCGQAIDWEGWNFDE